MKLIKIISVLLLLVICKGSFAQDWLNTKIAVDPSVPMPWTPLQVSKSNQGTVVKCWGRSYSFGQRGLITSINAQKEDIIYQPISFLVNNYAETLSSTEVVKNSPNEVVLRRTINYGNKGVLVANISIKYDGLVYYKLSYNSSDLQNQNIKITIPFISDKAKYIHREADPSITRTGSWKTDFLNTNVGKLDNTPFISYFWVGDEKTGLTWFMESPVDWPNWNSDDAIVINRNVNGCTAILNLSTNNQKYKKGNLNLEFGLQATPTKSFDNSFRNIRISNLKANLNIIWPDTSARSLIHFGYPEAKNLNLFKDYVSKLQSSNRKALVYNCLTYISDGTNEWAKYKNKWSIGFGLPSADVVKYKEVYQRVNPDKNFEDFMIWKSNSFIDEGKFDGYYLDNSIIVDVNNYGKNIRKEEKSIPYYPYMKFRGLYERFYKMVKSKGNDKLIIANASSKLFTPILSFTDAFVDGEQFGFQQTKVDDDYLKVVNLAYFQTILYGKQFGIAPILLPTFPKKSSLIKWPTQRLVTLTVLHDTGVWPTSFAQSYLTEWQKKYDIPEKYKNLSEAEFIPYFVKNALFNSNEKNVYVSTYRFKNNDLLCVVGNLNDLSTSARINLIPSLSLQNYILDALNNSVKILDKSSIQINIDGNNFSTFLLKNKQ